MDSVGELLDQKGHAVATANATTRLSECARLMGENSVGSLVIVDEDGRLEGILTWRDIIGAVADHPNEFSRRRASDLMTRDVVTIDEATTLSEADERMLANFVHHLPVLRRGHVIGVITVGDVLRRRLREAEALTDEFAAFLERHEF